MIPRELAAFLSQSAERYPVVTLTGPRQSGKTTLCRHLFAGKPYLSLEAPDIRRFAIEDPRGFLAELPEGAILDEIQRAPELPSYLQVLVDDDPRPGRFILTGSQQFELMRGISQSLAGRTAVLRLLPLTLGELAVAGLAPPTLAQTLLTGFYPRIYDQGLDPAQTLADYFATYVERDLRQLAAIQDLLTFERFVKLCAGRVGQLLNLASLASDAGIAASTARHWLELLQASYIVFLLPPWLANTTKRLVKSPKLYFYDVGLACWLLDLRTPEQVGRDPLLGGLVENLVIADVMKRRFNRGEIGSLYFYRDAKGLEVDLLIPSGRQFHAVEIKAGATVSPDYFTELSRFAASFPETVASRQIVYGGEAGQTRGGITVLPWQEAASALPVA
ncbi:MAG: ATP-binding protein [Rhodocyclaceae bacterium]|nr:ATP-binding protein [Rhodocyclaceae bacterium]